MLIFNCCIYYYMYLSCKALSLHCSSKLFYTGNLTIDQSFQFTQSEINKPTVVEKFNICLTSQGFDRLRDGQKLNDQVARKENGSFIFGAWLYSPFTLSHEEIRDKWQS